MIRSYLSAKPTDAPGLSAASSLVQSLFWYDLRRVTQYMSIGVIAVVMVFHTEAVVLLNFTQYQVRESLKWMNAFKTHQIL